MTEHFIEMLSSRTLPPPEARTLAQRITAADQQWNDIRAALRVYAGKKSVVAGSDLFLSLSRFVHELIPEPDLRNRLLQHFEMQLKADFPPPPGRLLS